MTEYAISNNPGSVRRRTRYIGIRIPLDIRTDQEKIDGVSPQPPSIDILEQDVVRIANCEKVIQDLSQIPNTTFDPNEVFDVRNPNTDELLGTTATVGEAMTLIYSWVRKKQIDRDNAQ